MDRKRLEAKLARMRRAYNDFVDLRALELSRESEQSICAESFKMIEALLDNESTRVKKELGIFSHDHMDGRKRKKKLGRPKQKKVVYKITVIKDKVVTILRTEPVQLDLFGKTVT